MISNQPFEAVAVTSRYFRGWIEQLLNASTRVTLLLVQPDFADIVLEAAAEHNMIDSVYAWIASTAVTQSFVRIPQCLCTLFGFSGLLNLCYPAERDNSQKF